MKVSCGGIWKSELVPIVNATDVFISKMLP